MTCKKNVKDKIEQSFEHMNVFYDEKIGASSEARSTNEADPHCSFCNKKRNLICREKKSGIR